MEISVTNSKNNVDPRASKLIKNKTVISNTSKVQYICELANHPNDVNSARYENEGGRRRDSGEEDWTTNSYTSKESNITDSSMTNESNDECKSNLDQPKEYDSKREEFDDLLFSHAAVQVQITETGCIKPLSSKFICSYCLKGFAKKQQLQNHIKTHTNEKKFNCEMCSKRFVHKQQLTNHEKTHTGKKDFQCPFCNKCFVFKQQMQIHIKTHTGEKNFECNLCDKAFITKQQLQNHINSHLGIKPFICSVCCKNFAHKQQLLQHEKRHEKQVHFCVECNLKFRGKNLLTDHVNSVHKEYNNCESIYSSNNFI